MYLKILEKTLNYKILSAIFTVGGFTIVVKLASTVQHLIVANQFGTSDALDAYFIAYLAPCLAVNVIGGALIMSSTDLIDKSMAVMVDAGSVSALTYGNKLTSFILGIGSIALGTAIFPYFSSLVAHRNWKRIKEVFKSYSVLILMTTIPLTRMKRR